MSDPILFDFPYSFESERLIIEGPSAKGVQELRTAVIESQAELKPWLPWAVNIPSPEKYEALIRKARLKYLAREDLMMWLRLKENNTLVGGSGLHRIDWDVPKFEIGYWVRTKYAGRGYITEAVAAITDFAFTTLKAERIEIRCDVKNKPSAAIPKRLGFTLEGTLRQDTRDHITNELRDTHIYAKIRV